MYNQKDLYQQEHEYLKVYYLKFIFAIVLQ